MVRNLSLRMVIIVVILALAIWIDASNKLTITNPFDQSVLASKDVPVTLGLDLQGGVQVLMEADVDADTQIDPAKMEVVRSIIENRTNALGVSENSIQVAGTSRIVGEFPGAKDAEAILNTLEQTGLLEFVDTGDTYLEPGTEIVTDFAPRTSNTPADPNAPAPVVYHTVMTGSDLDFVNVAPGQLGVLN